MKVTLEELGRVGYGALRVEEVAKRSGVNKTTIYRRWPNKVQLLSAAMSWLQLAPVLSDTGDLQHDLIESYATQLERVNTELVRGLVRMLQNEQGDPDVDATMREVKLRHSTPRIDRLRSAVARGDLPSSTDVEFLNEVMSRALYGRLSRAGEVLTKDFVAKVVVLVLAGARALR
jgi:AcrR family transcriptional regulator